MLTRCLLLLPCRVDAGKVELDGASYAGLPLPFTITQLIWIEVLAVGGAEFYRNSELTPEKRCYPGGLFDPLNLASEDEERAFKLKTAEIKHGRLAMVAFFGEQSCKLPAARWLLPAALHAAVLVCSLRPYCVLHLSVVVWAVAGSLPPELAAGGAVLWLQALPRTATVCVAERTLTSFVSLCCRLRRAGSVHRRGCSWLPGQVRQRPERPVSTPRSAAAWRSSGLAASQQRALLRTSAAAA